MFTLTFYPHSHLSTTNPSLTHPCFFLYLIHIIYLQYGRTPLHFAAQRGHLNIVEWLVETKEMDITHGDEVSIGYGVERS